MDTALEKQNESVASRCGVFRTNQVSVRTPMLLLRHRFHIISRQNGKEWPLLAEDCQIIGFQGSSNIPEWLNQDRVNTLFNAEPDANVSSDQASYFLSSFLDNSGFNTTAVGPICPGKR